MCTDRGGVQALELASAQSALRRLHATYATVAPAGSRPALIPALARHLGQFLVSSMLQERSATRAAYATRLGFPPLPQPPFPAAVLAEFRDRVDPLVAEMIPDAPAFILLGSSDATPTLWATLLRAQQAGGLCAQRAQVIPGRRHLATHCYLAVGIESAAAAKRDGGAPHRHLRLCGVLFTCIGDAVGRAQRIEGMEVMPARVFRVAEDLFSRGASPEAVLAAVRGAAAAPAAAVAVGGKRPRAGSSEGVDEPPSKWVRVDGAAAPAAAVDRSDEVAAARPWGPAEVAHERLQVGCMLAWGRTRALASHLRAHLTAAGVAFTEERPVSDGGGGAASLAACGRAAFVLSALPQRPEPGRPDTTAPIPEPNGAWPQVLLDRSGLRPAAGTAPPPPGVQSARIVVTGATTWRTEVTSPLLRAVVQAGGGGAAAGGWGPCPAAADALSLIHI